MSDNPIIINARETAQYLNALVEARTAVDAGLNPPPELSGQDLTDYLTSCRNRALAGDGLKAAFLGTISTEPTVTQAELVARGVKEIEAGMLITERDVVRFDALGLV
jgi:hypothetical protein